MANRAIAATWLSLLGLGTAAFLISCGTGCGMCACPPDFCTELTITSADSGTTFRMAVGEWISLRLVDQGVPAAGWTSDPNTLKMTRDSQTAIVGSPIVFASFHALRPGSAQLAIGYVTCPTTSPDPCSYEVDIDVVEFPKVTVDIGNVYMQNVVQVHVGDVVRFKAPAATPQISRESIDAPRVVGWAVEPIYLDFGNGVEAAVKALAPGTAHVRAGACSSTAPVCTNPWVLTIVVG